MEDFIEGYKELTTTRKVPQIAIVLSGPLAKNLYYTIKKDEYSALGMDTEFMNKLYKFMEKCDCTPFSTELKSYSEFREN